ncbi:hypothetical protein [Runella zeae]|uniref:hypothetical protein n=1 Tax=Runella zeae TaxID=94255 RepID=UPI00235630E8|nr:hypothetical protein [Runella zeae]
MTINVQDVVTQYGSYYQQGTQGVNDLYSVAMRDFVTREAFTLMITRDTVYKAARVIMDSLIQPFQVGFTPRASEFKFEPIEIVQHHMKVDESISPDSLMPTWLGFLAGNEVKREDWPFIRWFLEKYFFPKIGEDMELNEIGIGVATAPTTGTAGPVKTSMNGVQTILNAHISAGRTVPITMGAIPSDDELLVEYIEDFVDQISKNYWRRDMTVYLSETLERRYLRGHRKVYGKDTNSVVGKGGTNKIEFTSQSIKGLPSMNMKNNSAACNRIFCTPKENAVMMMSEANPFRKLDIQAVDRVVKLLTDWWMGVGFILPEVVFCNDQE